MVELPRGARRRSGLAARQPGLEPPACLGADGVDGRPRHDRISATRAGITGMLEPVLAIVVAWLWLGESLAPLQLSGAVVTLAGISLAQTSR
ncbi:MAG: DMT family transporter [Actinobacteria bacterium]|nr:MAG: DMT family transporter [Actinomycetota bacterium]